MKKLHVVGVHFTKAIMMVEAETKEGARLLAAQALDKLKAEATNGFLSVNTIEEVIADDYLSAALGSVMMKSDPFTMDQDGRLHALPNLHEEVTHGPVH